MRAGIVLVCAWLAAWIAAPVSAEKPEGAASARPSYRELRFEEDWSVLADPEALPSQDFFDPIKYLPLRSDGQVWLSLGGQLRARLEGWNNFDFGTPDDSDAVLLLTRVMAHADLHLHPAVRVFAEAKSALSTDHDVFDDVRKLDADSIDLQNGFLELTGKPWRLPATLRLGRQELRFGRQRLVSPLDWANARRSFDGATLALELADWSITGFGTRPVRVRRNDFNDHPKNSAFYGIYAQGPLPGVGSTLDLYAFGRHRDDLALEGSAGDEERATLGGRLSGAFGGTGLDYDLEGAWQGGEIGDHDVDAFMVASEIGWWLSESRLSPRFYAGFDYASGDGATGGYLELFDPLFPLGHAYFGAADLIGRQNLVSPSGGVSLRAFTRTTVELSGYGFWRAERDSGLYDASARQLRAGALGSSRELGYELDLLVKHRLDPHTLIAAGYAHFFAGRFVEQSGPGGDVDFGYLILQYTF
jgi:hypothetical protein